MKTEDKQVIVALSTVPVSIIASVCLWSSGEVGFAFAPPAVMAVVAPLVALDFRNTRNGVWIALVLQVLVMIALSVFP